MANNFNNTDSGKFVGFSREAGVIQIITTVGL